MGDRSHGGRGEEAPRRRPALLAGAQDPARNAYGELFSLSAHRSRAPPRRIDVITGIDGVTFVEAWPNRVSVEIGGLEIPCLGRADLVKNKRSTGRAKDLLDVELLRSGEASD